MFKFFNIFLLISSILLYAEKSDKFIFDNPRYDSINIVTEINSKLDFWTPGLPKDEGQYLLTYDTEGLNVILAKVKLQMHNSDILSYEYFVTSSKLENEYRKNQSKEVYAEGIRGIVHFGKILAHLSGVKELGGFSFEYTKRDFSGLTKLTRDACYWYGEDCEDPNSMWEYDDTFTFQTKFQKKKFYYTWDDLLWGFDFSLGYFDIHWSKPTFLNVLVYQEVPVFFDAKYHSQGISFDISKKSKNHDFQIYFDYGIENDMDLTDSIAINDILKKDQHYSMYIAGASYNYILEDIYSNSYFTTDFSLGSNIRWIRMGREYTDIGLDGEFNFGLNANFEFIF